MSSALRQQHHETGRQHLTQGKYLEALDCFQGALAKYGPHVGLLSDIATSFYLLGRIEDCVQATRRLQNELKTASDFLSDKSFVKTAIFLGKMLEEQGHVAEALEQYQAALTRANELPDLRVNAQAQLLRLRSFLGIKTELHNFYQICLQSHSTLDDLNIELEHALMLAELELFGTALAKERLDGLFQRYDLLSADQRLLTVDFLEHILLSKQDIGEIQDRIDRIPKDDADEFERLILAMAQPDYTVYFMTLNKAAKELPFMGFLRVLFLSVQLSQNNNVRTELRKKFLFLVDSLPKESAKLLSRKWPLPDQLLTDDLEIQFTGSRLLINGKEITIKENSFNSRCLRAFAGRNEMPIEKFVETVFESQYNSSYHDRVRIALQRLNKDLKAISGIQKFFSLDKSTVRLNRSVKIS